MISAEYMNSSLRRFRTLSVLFVVLATLVLSTPLAQARDLTGRLGLGYNAEFANSDSNIVNHVPAISLKYAISKDLGIEGVVGFNTGSPANDVVGLKFFKNIFYETNLNFYFMAGAAAVQGNSKSGAQIISGFGVEFFFPGLESLGFAMETGASLDNLGGSYALKTLGFSFLNAGIHFYF